MELQLSFDAGKLVQQAVCQHEERLREGRDLYSEVAFRSFATGSFFQAPRMDEGWLSRQDLRQGLCQTQRQGHRKPYFPAHCGLGSVNEMIPA